MAHNATSLMLQEEIARVRKERRHAIAMTPLASVPLSQGKRKRRPVMITRSPGQVMRYAKHPKSSY